MKTSLIQIFDKEADAKAALAATIDAFPSNQHFPVRTCNVVKARAKLNGAFTNGTFGTDEADGFLVVSLAPED